MHEDISEEGMLFLDVIYGTIQEHLLPYYKENISWFKLNTQLVNDINLVHLEF